MVSRGAFMRFGHDKVRLLAVDALQKHFGCGPSMEFSIEDDVMGTPRIELSCNLFLGR